MSIYDLFDVSIGGEIVSARPIEWSSEDEGDGLDSDGLPIGVTKYNGTCPSCAQLIEFTLDEVVFGVDFTYVVCMNCGAGPTKEQAKSGEVVVRHVVTDDDYTFQDGQAVLSPGNEKRPKVSAQTKDEIKITPAKEDCPFQDPVEAGELKPAKA